uniref:Uncharacterized protein n=1 Tax=Schistosoma japonicum TaxID=6182 RepID=C1LFT2_SCHJA|nr:hypothetical protein [Schistosoma japonicum]
MSSSSSSSSLLYINVLLLVLIHSSIQQENPKDATTNARNRLHKVQGLMEEYQQNFTTSENNLNQSINRLIDKHPSEEKKLTQYKVCETRLLTIEFIVRSLRDVKIFERLIRRNYPKHSEKVIQKLNKLMVKAVNDLNPSVSKEKIKICDEPENIDLQDLTIVDKLLLKYLNDKNYFQLNKLKEMCLVELIEVLKNSAKKRSVK